MTTQRRPGRAIGDHVLDVTPSVQGQLMPRQQPATTARPLHSFQRGVAREGVPANECGMTKRNPAIGEGLRGGLAANLAVAQKEEREGCALQRAWPARIRFAPGIYAQVAVKRKRSTTTFGRRRERARSETKRVSKVRTTSTWCPQCQTAVATRALPTTNDAGSRAKVSVRSSANARTPVPLERRESRAAFKRNAQREAANSCAPISRCA